MKIKTKEQFSDLIQQDFGWRKKELIAIRQRVELAKSVASINTEMRTGVLLLYAHWEGFIKTACSNYLDFVKYRKLNMNELPDNLLALSLKSELQELESTGQHILHLKFVQFIKTSLSKRATWNLDKAIDTKSNLNSEVLENILSVVGIPFTDFELKSNLIDEQLLKHRNNIAHGNGNVLDFDKNGYLKVHDEIYDLLQLFYNHLSNLVTLEKYKVSA
jgi:hypothetical protein